MTDDDGGFDTDSGNDMKAAGALNDFLGLSMPGLIVFVVVFWVCVFLLRMSYMRSFG